MMEKILHYFKIKERNSSIRTELIAGITTFFSMSYILAVNPYILSTTGMNAQAVFVATAVAAILGTVIMGIYANYPIAQAPGMGMNAFFAYTIVGNFWYTWEEALFAVFASGLCFILISFSGIREQIITMIPTSLKYAVSAGIGFFITFVGLKNAGLIVSDKDTFVALGDFHTPESLVALFGIVLTIILVLRNIPGALFIGMIITALTGMMFGIVDVPLGITSKIPSLSPVFGKVFTQVDSISLLLDPKFLMLIFSVLFMDFFDATGTLLSVATTAGFVKKTGALENGNKALVSDAIETTLCAVIGTSSVTSYVESMTGVSLGGRTGLTALTVACLFFFHFSFSH